MSGGSGPMTQAYIDHLMFQYCGSFTRDHRFLMMLADMKMRHQTASNVKRSVMHSDGLVKLIDNLIRDDEFLSQLDTAVKEPNGTEAAKIFAMFSPVLKLGQGGIPFTTANTSTFAQTLYSASYFSMFKMPSLQLHLIAYIILLLQCLSLSNRRHELP